MSLIPERLDENTLKTATKKLALEVIRVAEKLPQTKTGDVLGRQLLRSATSVAANYRAACRAKSRADMIAKMGIVEEEADETCLWFELLTEAGILDKNVAEPLQRDYDRVTAIAVSSKKTLRSRKE
jgi:four helix bundle protein